MRYARIPGLVVLVSLLSSPAQTQTHRFFVGAGVIADKDETNSAFAPEALASWTMVAGIDGKRVGVRGVFEAPHEVVRSFEGTHTRPPSIFPVNERVSRTTRTMTYGVLGDVHGQVTPTLRLAGTFGLLTVTHDTRVVVVQSEVRPDGSRGPLPDFRDDQEHDWYGLTVGFEAALTFARRFEIVPEVRIIYFGPYDSHPYIFRSGVGARWRF